MRGFLGILSCFAVIQLSGCAPAELDAHQTDPNLTGFYNSAGAPYTVGGDPRIVESRSNPSATPPAPPASTKLSDGDAKLIKKIDGLYVQRENASKRIDRFGSARTLVKIKIDGKELIFAGDLKPMGAYRYQAVIPLTGYELTVNFTDEAEHKYTLGEMTLVQLDSKNRPVGRANISVRSYVAHTRTVVLADGLTPANLRQFELLKKLGLAWVSNLWVNQGRSYYDIQIWARPLPDGTGDEIERLASRRRFFSFSGESVRTDDPKKVLPAVVNRTAVPGERGLMNLLSAILRGSAESETERTFELVIEGYQNQNLNLGLHIFYGDLDTVPKSPTLRGFSDKSYLQVHYTNEIKRMIEDLEQNYSLPGVQEKIRSYLTGEPVKELTNALVNAQAFREIISGVFHYFDVAPQAALATLIVESDFFRRNNFPVQAQKDAKSSAVGPSQLLYKTALGLNMRVSPNAAGTLPPVWDERRYFLPSLCGQAKHYQRSLKPFARHDRTLALLAYYLGDEGTANVMAGSVPTQKKSNLDTWEIIKRFKFTYRNLEHQRMVPSDGREHVQKALALYFITGNPDAHRFAIPTGEVGPGLPEGKLYPPRPINDPECLEAIKPLQATGKLPQPKR